MVTMQFAMSMFMLGGIAGLLFGGLLAFAIAAFMLPRDPYDR